MHVLRICSIICVLAAISPLVAATSADHLAAGERLRDERKPKEAIAEFRQAIEAERFNVMVSGPALVAWVACHQLLASDQQAAAEYATESAMYLSHPPALDGKSTVDLDQAKEDLLWKSWTDQPLLAFAIGGKYRQSQIVRGQRREWVQLTLKPQQPEGMTTDSADHWPDSISKVVAVDETGKEYGTDLSLSFFSIHGAAANLEAPASVQKFARVTGSIRVSQPLEWKISTVALREGEQLDSTLGKATISSLHREDGQLTVGLQIAIPEVDMGGAVAASGSAMASANGDEGDKTSPLWLIDDAGGVNYPTGTSTGSTNGKIVSQLTFSHAESATKLVCRIIGKLSERDIPVDLKDVALP